MLFAGISEFLNDFFSPGGIWKVTPKAFIFQACWEIFEFNPEYFAVAKEIGNHAHCDYCQRNHNDSDNDRRMIYSLAFRTL